MIGEFDSVPASDARDDHGEGPSWDARTGQLLWVDQYLGLVRRADFDPGTGRLIPIAGYQVGAPVGAVVPLVEPGTGWLVAYDHGFGLLDPDGQVRALAQPVPAGPPRRRMNDGKCGPDGSFWAGTMAFDKSPGAGSLYRLAPDGQVSELLTGVTISNGLAWSADGRTLFYIDTPTQRIDRFELSAAGGLGPRRAVVTIPAQAGHPDGMTIDDEGCLWVALWDGWAVRRYAPDGELLATVAVDAPQVSSCCFGGPDRSILFITTSQEGMDAATRARYPNSGRVFRAEVGVRGPLARPWRGPA